MDKAETTLHNKRTFVYCVSSVKIHIADPFPTFSFVFN